MADAMQNQPPASIPTHNASGSTFITDQQNQHGSSIPLNVSSSPHGCSVSSNVVLGSLPENKNVCNSSSNNQFQVVIDRENEEYFKSLPPGYRFNPSDAELIVEYLNKKIKNEELPRNRIQEVNLYKYSPEIISDMYQGLGVKEWYFFTPRDRKYSNGTRPNRAAGTGYWKATGADRPIRKNGSTIGFRKALVFYEGKPPKGEKTSWIMHEYRVIGQPRKKSCATDMRLDDYVLCRIYKKTDRSFKGRQRNGDDYYLNSPIDQNVQVEGDFQQEVGSDSYHEDAIEEDYGNYHPQPISYNEDISIPHLQTNTSDISPTKYFPNFNANIYQSFNYRLEQKPPFCYVPMPSINPTSRFMPAPAPLYITTDDEYFKEKEKDYLPLPEYDIHNISFDDPEINLDTFLNNNPPSSPQMPIAKRESD